jgi:hypothetical protein
VIVDERRAAAEAALSAVIEQYRDVLGPRLIDEDGDPTEEPAPGLWVLAAWVVVVDFELLDDDALEVEGVLANGYTKKFSPRSVSWVHENGLLHTALHEMT